MKRRRRLDGSSNACSAGSTSYEGRRRALAEQTVGAVQRRVNATPAPQAELARAEAELGAEILQEDVEHELLSAYRELSAQWGQPQPDFATVAGDIGPPPTLDPFEDLVARVDATRSFCDLRRKGGSMKRSFASRRRGAGPAGESTADCAVSRQRTTKRSSPADRAARLEKPQSGRIAEARANIARTDAEAATRVDIETSLFVLYQELKHDVDVAGRLGRDIIRASKPRSTARAGFTRPVGTAISSSRSCNRNCSTRARSCSVSRPTRTRW
jgi:cobalt-zinc-cadmium efflux system outer membrane protein